MHGHSSRNESFRPSAADIFRQNAGQELIRWLWLRYAAREGNRVGGFLQAIISTPACGPACYSTLLKNIK